MSISSRVLITFTAAASENEMLSVEGALQAAGFTSLHREVHPLPAGTDIPLAPPTVEVTVARDVIDGHEGELREGLTAIRRQIPVLGLMLLVDDPAGRYLYSWKRSSSADEVAAGVNALGRSRKGPGAYGWDVPANAWTRA